MSNADAYRAGLTGRAKRNPYPSGSGEWKSWNLGKASRGRQTMKKNPARKPASPHRRAAMESFVGPYYVMKAGKRIYHRTLAAAQKFAQAVADSLGKPVSVHQAKRLTKKTVMRKNPAGRAAAARLEDKIQAAKASGWRVLGSNRQFYVEGPWNNGRGIYNKWFSSEDAAWQAIARARTR